jgi:hypothetical protein
MLYQLSYASALKPTKNSRHSEDSASSEPNFFQHAKGQHCGKGRPRSLPNNPYPFANNCFSKSSDPIAVENSRVASLELKSRFNNFKLDALHGVHDSTIQFPFNCVKMYCP